MLKLGAGAMLLPAAATYTRTWKLRQSVLVPCDSIGTLSGTLVLQRMLPVFETACGLWWRKAVFSMEWRSNAEQNQVCVNNNEWEQYEP